MPEGAALLARANAARRAFVKYAGEDARAEITTFEGALRSPAEGLPQVSVIIPTSDGYRHGILPKLLEQVRSQTFQDFEVFLIKGDTRQGRAINLGAALARGDVLLTLDDDALLGHARVFEQLIAALRAHPDIGMAGVSNLVPEQAPWLVRAAMTQIPRRSSPLVNEITDSDLAEHGCLAMRAHLFKQVGGENEWIPRGLDPYLRQAFRRAGARIVVIPEAWIHHLPPAGFRALLRQFWRNGVQSAYCAKQFPQWVIETPERHVGRFEEQVPAPRRALRYAGRLGQALVRGHGVYLATLLVYAAAYVWGWATTRRRPEP
jgi:hypothetical protein